MHNSFVASHLAVPNPISGLFLYWDRRVQFAEANPKHLEELRSQVAITQLQQNGKEITPTTISETANSLKPAQM